MDSSPGFGSTACNSIALFRLAFATATLPLNLATYSNSQAHYAKGTRSHLLYMVLPLLVSTRFQVLFHSPRGVLFTFPSRYWFTIGQERVFSLRRWSSQIHAGFHVPRATRVRNRSFHDFGYETFTLYGAAFQPLRLPLKVPRLAPHNPGPRMDRFRLFPFRSPLLRESFLLSFPLATKMFQFTRFASNTYEFSAGYLDMTRDGFPHSGISGSAPASGSPKLIAACYALHRLLLPRHPPCALSRLVKPNISCTPYFSLVNELAARMSHARAKARNGCDTPRLSRGVSHPLPGGG